MDKVKLIAITKPLVEGMDTAEDLIAYCARVSNTSNQNNKETSSKLLKYCIENNHWSIFEMCHLVIEINCTRTIGRQILRHRSFSFQEFSQRYAEVSDDMFVQEYMEARLQDVKNRQNSISVDDTNLQWQFDRIQEEAIQDGIKRYNEARNLGIAKEQARVVLPEGLTMSRMYMSGSLRSWIHYCALRMGNGTQLEHQNIAKQCWEIILEKFPALKGFCLSYDGKSNTVNVTHQ